MTKEDFRERCREILETARYHRSSPNWADELREHDPQLGDLFDKHGASIDAICDHIRTRMG